MHLRESEAVSEAPRIYHCALCGFSTRTKLQLLQHVRSMKHLQMEQIHQLQRRSEGKELQTDIGEVFQVISQLDPPGFGDSEPGKATVSSPALEVIINKLQVTSFLTVGMPYFWI
jgi:AT-binding transcription factor 1